MFFRTHVTARKKSIIKGIIEENYKVINAIIVFIKMRWAESLHSQNLVMNILLTLPPVMTLIFNITCRGLADLNSPVVLDYN